MTWTANTARRTCAGLLRTLTNLEPNIRWDRVGADGDDGLIYFANGNAVSVRVKIARTALEGYVDANHSGKEGKGRLLAQQMRAINSSGLTEALIQSEHLAA